MQEVAEEVHEVLMELEEEEFWIRLAMQSYLLSQLWWVELQAELSMERFRLEQQ